MTLSSAYKTQYASKHSDPQFFASPKTHQNRPQTLSNNVPQRKNATERNGRHVTGKGREHQRELATKGLHTYRYIAYTVAYYSKVSCYRRITANWVSFWAGTLYYTIGEHSCERQKHPDDKGRSGCTNDP